jgi:hypothetical protein
MSAGVGNPQTGINGVPKSGRCHPRGILVGRRVGWLPEGHSHPSYSQLYAAGSGVPDRV